MAYFHCRTLIRTLIPVLCSFYIGSDSDSDPLIEMYLIGRRSVLKMGTVTIWERDPNPSPGQWKHVLRNTM